MHDALTTRWAIAALLAATGLIWTTLRSADEPAPQIVVTTRVERVPQPVMVPGPPIVVRVPTATPSVSAPSAMCPAVPPVPAPPDAPRLSARQIAELANTDWGVMFDHFSEMTGSVAMAPGRPEIAYVVSHGDSGRVTVYFSRDNGRSVRAVLAGPDASDDRILGATAIDCAGRLYVVRGDAIGVLDTAGREHWHGFPLAVVGEAWGRSWMTTVGPWVLWAMGDQIAASGDGGATWRSLGDAYALSGDELVPTERALYVRRGACDAATVCLDRLDPATGQRASLRVRVAYVEGEESMTATRTADGWQLGLRCPGSPYGADYGVDCAAAVTADDLRWASTVAPDLIEGEARVHHEIVCTGSAPNVCFLVASDATSRRIVASAPPGFVAGVDGNGEPVATLYTQLLRWSPARGWR